MRNKYHVEATLDGMFVAYLVIGPNGGDKGMFYKRKDAEEYAKKLNGTKHLIETGEML